MCCGVVRVGGGVVCVGDLGCGDYMCGCDVGGGVSVLFVVEVVFCDGCICVCCGEYVWWCCVLWMVCGDAVCCGGGWVVLSVIEVVCVIWRRCVVVYCDVEWCVGWSGVVCVGALFWGGCV